MSFSQLKFSISLTIKSILDSSLPLNFRNQFVVILFKLFEDLKKRPETTIHDYGDLFECLSLYCKDLNFILKILIAELSTLKQDLANIKKTNRVKWMNDVEQKNAEIRDLIMADNGVPFVDLSKEKTFPPEKFNLNKA